MEDYETMVENEDFDAEADDTLPEDIEEEQDESESLDSLTEEEEEQEPAAEPETPSASEPGWIKQRVNKAVQKAVAETERRMQAMFDQQMAPIREKMLNDEAREMVQKGLIKDLETAKELIRYRQGQPQAPVQQEQPRNDQGQFAPKQDPVTSTRVDMLAHQADAIKAETGFDVIDVFTNDEDIKQRVISGELDFYDVARMMNGSGQKRPPAPMRSPNGASGSVQPNAIQNMSDEQFERMEKKIREGARYSLR